MKRTMWATIGVVVLAGLVAMPLLAQQPRVRAAGWPAAWGAAWAWAPEARAGQVDRWRSCAGCS